MTKKKSKPNNDDRKLKKTVALEKNILKLFSFFSSLRFHIINNNNSNAKNLSRSTGRKKSRKQKCVKVDLHTNHKYKILLKPTIISEAHLQEVSSRQLFLRSRKKGANISNKITTRLIINHVNMR